MADTEEKGNINVAELLNQADAGRCDGVYVAGFIQALIASDTGLDLNAATYLALEVWKVHKSMEIWERIQILALKLQNGKDPVTVNN